MSNATGAHTIVYAEDAADALVRLQPKLRQQVLDKIEKLSVDPHPPGCKKLVGASHGGASVYRIRCGKHRVLYSVGDKGKVATILDIDFRKDIYR